MTLWIFFGWKGRKKMLGIDQGTRFVFCCGLQIDLWTELRVKSGQKTTFLGGLGGGLFCMGKNQKKLFLPKSILTFANVFIMFLGY